MANIFQFDGQVPAVHPTAFVHPNAAVTGNVVIGAECYIGPGAALRGDWGAIVIADGCNVQENCTIHMFPGVTVTLEEGAHIGHGAVVHGAHIGRNVLVGMNAVVMDEAVVGEGSIIGALTFVPAGMEVPPRKLVVGNPGRVVKDVSDAMLAWKTAGTALYRALPAEMHRTWRPAEALPESRTSKPVQPRILDTWKAFAAKLPPDER